MEALKSNPRPIPSHLLPYVSKQDPSLYTPMDHAGWRFILKISQAFFRKHAHPVYLDGLEKTGISTERIPLISEMDEKLRRFGWGAVPVCGFVPPAVFMEFLSLGILPIACDMRRMEHLGYTPAPDIVHEAAGHAPIIADPAYAAYLRRYGEISRKAIHSDSDWDVYLAIRNLSDTKENPASTAKEIASAQERLDQALARVAFVSEAAQLARMSWWTIEYGLIGPLERPKIYGAGLLSSVAESYHCLGSAVPKVPFSLKCVETGYDITRPQTQLFVAKDFESLSETLEELADTMAFRRGGAEGLEKARQARTVTTVLLDSGLQISGRLSEFLTNDRGDPLLLRHEGPIQVAREDREVDGHGPGNYPSGLITPLGEMKRVSEDCWEVGSDFLARGQFHSDEQGILVLKDARLSHRKPSEHSLVYSSPLMTLVNGKRVSSVFGGAADRAAYLSATGGFEQPPGVPKTNLTEANRRLNALYGIVRGVRESGRLSNDAESLQRLDLVHAELEADYPDDWLLRYELLELDSAWGLRSDWAPTIRERLSEIGRTSRQKAEMIKRGLELL